MAWLALENGKLLNTDLVSTVVFDPQHEEKADAYGYELLMGVGSRVIHDFFKPLFDADVKRQEALQSGAVKE